MRRGVGTGLAGGILLAVVVAAFAWWRFDDATRPEAVTTRLIDGLVARHPGTIAGSIGPAIVEAMLPSGIFVDVRDDAVADACRRHRMRCTAQIGRALDDVDRAEAANRAPRRDALRPAIIGDSSGYRYGFVTAAFFNSLELRYVLKAGLASTFVTRTIADQFELSGERLREAAQAGQQHDGAATLEKLAGDGPALYRVIADGDPVAVLLDHARLAAFAEQLGSRRLVCHVPSRGILYVAAAGPATESAFKAMRVPRDGTPPIGLEPFTVDLDAPPAAALATVRNVK